MFFTLFCKQEKFHGYLQLQLTIGIYGFHLSVADLATTYKTTKCEAFLRNVILTFFKICILQALEYTGNMKIKCCINFRDTLFSNLAQKVLL